jgi:hypothetical protein
MTTAFLNNAIGKLYNIYDKEKLNQYISMKNISKSDLNLVKKVIDRAKIKFSKETSYLKKSLKMRVKIPLMSYELKMNKIFFDTNLWLFYIVLKKF